MLSPRSGDRKTRWVNWFVYGSWFLLLCIAIAFVAAYGTNIPSLDDWDMVPTMTHQQPITVAWLWSQHNEHRIPLARLVMLVMYYLWPDFRICMYLNVAMMGVLAFALVRCTQRLRGRVALTDVFFPLILLGLAQGLNFVWAWQVEFFTATAVSLCILLLIADYQDTQRVTRAVLASMCLALLIASGAHGLALVPLLSLWPASLAILRSSSDEMRLKGPSYVLLSLSVVLLGLVGLYMSGYQHVPYFPTSPSAGHTLKTALEFLTMAFGPAVERWWPISGLTMALTLTGALVAVMLAGWRYREQRPRALGFFLFIGAMTSLALAIGLGRNGFEPRYITLAVPVLCCVYLIFTVYLFGAVRRYALAGLLVLCCACFWVNTRSGLDYGHSLRRELGSLEAEMKRGAPPYQLIHAHLRSLHPNPQLINDYLPMLRRAKIGQFRFLRDNPQFQQTTVPLTPLEMRNATFDDGAFHTTGPDSAIIFAVPHSLQAAGIRLKYTVENKQGTPPLFWIAWRGDDTSSFATDRSYYISPTGDRANWERGSWLRIGHQETELTLWVCDRIRQIRIKPDAQACVFRLAEITLLSD